MAEIEGQLRRYADAVGAAVEPLSRNSEMSPRGRFPVMAGAAMLVLVAGLALWWLSRPATVDVIDQPDVVADGGATTTPAPPSTTTIAIASGPGCGGTADR